MTTERNLATRRFTRLSGALVAATLTVVAVGCGDDDRSSTNAEASTTQAPQSDDPAPPAAFVDFCDALDAYRSAQDGAQLNTAIGEMQEALEEIGDDLGDATDEASAALQVLSTGDLDTAEYVGAETALEEFGTDC